MVSQLTPPRALALQDLAARRVHRLLAAGTSSKAVSVHWSKARLRQPSETSLLLDVLVNPDGLAQDAMFARARPAARVHSPPPGATPHLLTLGSEVQRD